MRAGIQKILDIISKKFWFWPKLKIKENARDLIPSLASIKKLMNQFGKFAHHENFGQTEKTNNAVT